MKTDKYSNGVWCAAARASALVCVLAFSSSAATNDIFGGTYANWPSTWTAISSLNDPIDAGIESKLDFVGDSSDPGAYYNYSVASPYLFMRMRVHTNAAAYTDNFWIYVDCVGSGPEKIPEYGFAWDTQGGGNENHGVEMLYSNTIGAAWSNVDMEDRDGSRGLRIAPPDFRTNTGDAYLRVIEEVPTVNFGTTLFIDWAINLNYVTQQMPNFKIGNWKFQFGSAKNKNDHSFPNADIAGGFSTASTLTSSWSSLISIPEPVAVVVVLLFAGALRRRC